MNDAIQDVINGWAGHAQLLDDAMQLIAKDLIYLVVPLLIVLWFVPGEDRALRQRVSLAVPAAVVLALAIGLAAGHLYSDSRPFVSDPGTRQLISHSADNGFPSDHALVGFAAASTLMSWRLFAGLAVMAAAALIGFARIFVGVHWPLDILGGAVIGVLASGMLGRMTPLLESIQRRAAAWLPPWLVSAPKRV
jgi:undecaprenyl-diphosphatase